MQEVLNEADKLTLTRTELPADKFDEKGHTQVQVKDVMVSFEELEKFLTNLLADKNVVFMGDRPKSVFECGIELAERGLGFFRKVKSQVHEYILKPEGRFEWHYKTLKFKRFFNGLDMTKKEANGGRIQPKFAAFDIFGFEVLDDYLAPVKKEVYESESLKELKVAIKEILNK